MSTSSTNTLGKYQIIREIARSNDIVYEALDPSINRRIALKELQIPPDLQGSARRERIERFWREGKAAGRLSHPNIVTIYEVGKDGDRHFIAMEYLEGQTLRDQLKSGGPLPLKQVTDYAIQLCSALSYAHQNGVVHRDIKPENVQVLPGGYVKLTDFGIARLMGEPSITQDGQVFGTPSYMSPEQVAGKHIDQRSDVFSLGVLVYEMVAGQKPFTGDGIVTITYNIMNMEPTPPPGAPPYLVSVIRKAMNKDPNMRYQSADDMAEDIKNQNASTPYSMDTTGYGMAPAPLSGSWPPQQPQVPITPYGTPLPSTGAGASPDPFAQGSPSPSAAPLPPAPPPQPIMSAETRNFLGVFLLMVALLGMLGFAIWAVGLAFKSYQIASTSGIAQKYYDQGNKIYSRGDLPAAVEQWSNAIRVSPDSDSAKKAREAIFNISATLAGQYLDQRNVEPLKTEAKALIEAGPDRPEGHYYMGAGLYLAGDTAKSVSEYEFAVRFGGNDYHAQNARHSLVTIYTYQGDQLAGSGRKEDAIAAYQKAVNYCDSGELPTVQGKINSVGR